jgi:hypothetical protein
MAFVSAPIGANSRSSSGATAWQGEKNSAVKDLKATGDLSTWGAWERMLRTNPIVAAGHLGMVSALQSVTHEIAPCGADPVVVQYTHDLLFTRLGRRWKDITRTLWFAPVYGPAPHEVTTRLDDGLLWLDNLAFRPPSTLNPSAISAGGPTWVNAIQQFIGPDGRAVTAKFGAPDSGDGWLFWPTFGEGLFGEPILRPVYHEHTEKEEIRKITKIAIQKALFGPPLVFSKEPIPATGTTEHASYTKTLTEIGDAIYHEQGVVGLPPWVGEVRQLFADSSSLEQAVKIEDHCDIQTLLCFNAQYLARGLFSAYGSNAASKTDQGEQRAVRRFFLDWLSGAMQPLIDWFVDYNFGPQKFYPELLSIYRTELETTEETSDWAKLVAAGALSTSDADEEHHRRAHGWPAKDPDAERPETAEPTARYDEKTGTDTRERPSEGDYT